MGTGGIMRKCLIYQLESCPGIPMLRLKDVLQVSLPQLSPPLLQTVLHYAALMLALGNRMCVSQADNYDCIRAQRCTARRMLAMDGCLGKLDATCWSRGCRDYR